MKGLLGLYNRPDIVEAILNQHNKISIPKCTLCERGKINFIAVNITSKETGMTYDLGMGNITPKYCPLCGRLL